jgi:hypothetical protein
MKVEGLRTAWKLRGDPCIPLELAPPPKQSITVSRSFGHRLSTCEEIQQPLIAHVSRDPYLMSATSRADDAKPDDIVFEQSQEQGEPVPDLRRQIGKDRA